MVEALIRTYSHMTVIEKQQQLSFLQMKQKTGRIACVACGTGGRCLFPVYFQQ